MNGTDGGNRADVVGLVALVAGEVGAAARYSMFLASCRAATGVRTTKWWVQDPQRGPQGDEQRHRVGCRTASTRACWPPRLWPMTGTGPPSRATVAKSHSSRTSRTSSEAWWFRPTGARRVSHPHRRSQGSSMERLRSPARKLGHQQHVVAVALGDCRLPIRGWASRSWPSCRSRSSRQDGRDNDRRPPVGSGSFTRCSGSGWPPGGGGGTASRTPVIQRRVSAGSITSSISMPATFRARPGAVGPVDHLANRAFSSTSSVTASQLLVEPEPHRHLQVHAAELAGGPGHAEQGGLEAPAGHRRAPAP